MKILFSISLLSLILLFACKDSEITDIQKAQNEVYGKWIITELSNNFCSSVETKRLVSSKLTFDKCNTKNIDGIYNICTGKAEIIGSNFNVFYYNDTKNKSFKFTILIEPPYKKDEPELINAFSGYYLISIVDKTLTLKLIKRGEKDSPITEDIFIKAKKEE